MASNFAIKNPEVFARIAKRLGNVRKPIDKKTAQKVGRSTVQLMKSRISGGKSPILGKGKFGAYRGGYRTAIQRGRFPGKTLQPVNLKLSGKFLKTLGFRTFSNKKLGHIVRIQFVGPGSKTRSAPIEQGHREGANRQARRPIIPEPDRGEDFTRDIQSAINNILNERLNQIIRKK